MSKIKNGIDYVGITYIDTGSTETQPEYKTKVIEMGVWDMDATGSIAFAHGLTTAEWESLIDIRFIIRDDVLTERYSCPDNDTNCKVIGSNVVLSRFLAGKFDNPLFNSTAINRGWVSITYQPDN